MDFQDLSNNIQDMLESVKDEALRQVNNAKNEMEHQRSMQNSSRANSGGRTSQQAGSRWEDRVRTPRFNNGGRGRQHVYAGPFQRRHDEDSHQIRSDCPGRAG